MTYHDGSPVTLGDFVSVALQAGHAKARVVFLGDTQEHLDIDPGFLRWVQAERLVGPEQVVLEWVGSNPFAHDDASYAPVGNFMFTGLDSRITLNA